MRRMRLALAAAALLALPFTALAQDAAEPPTPASVIAAAPASDWRPIDPADLLVMDLAPDAAGKERRVIVQLMPPPFSQGWVENIRALARAHWWDGTSVYRVVDNWVAQWGDVNETKALPEAVSEQPDDTYIARGVHRTTDKFGYAMGSTDAYAPMTFFFSGWAIGTDDMRLSAWPLHCYGSVGVARSVGSGGTGSELYAVIGHAPRQLDRNIAVVGRVIEGIEHLSVLPRGTGDAGVYKEAVERTPILSARLGTEMPEPPRFEYLDTDSQSFADYAHIRANRHDSFYLHSAGGIDVCNVQVPIRRVPSQ